MNQAGTIMHGEYKLPGGKLVVADFTVVDGRFSGVQVSGDFFLEPDSALDAIDAALEGLSIDLQEAALAAAIHAALGPEVQCFGITPEAVAVALRRALEPAGEAADAEGGA
jgi:lipoate-protein ligase A